MDTESDKEYMDSEPSHETEPAHSEELSLQQFQSLPQPIQSTSQETHPISAYFPFSLHQTPELAQIMSITGSYPGAEDSDDPLRIPPDAFDIIMAWDIDKIYANNTYVRMPYTDNFRPEENTSKTSLRTTENTSPLHEFKEFKPRTLLVKEVGAATDAKGKNKVKGTKPGQEHSSAPVTASENSTSQQVDSIPLQMEETESSTSLSQDSIYNLAPYNRPNRHSNSRSYGGREESYKYTPRIPYQRLPAPRSPQYPPLPPPQRPYGQQKNQWPGLNSPHSPYQPKEQPQDNTKPHAHQGRPSNRGRGKSTFRKYSRYFEQSTQTKEPVPSAEGGDKQSKTEEELPKNEQKKESEKNQQCKEEQGSASKEEASKNGHKREESTSTSRCYKNEKSKFFRRNISETSTQREEIAMQQNEEGIEQEHMETNQGQFQSSKMPSYPGYVGQPVTNTQPVYYSPVYPGSYFEQSNPGQSQSPNNTSQEDLTHPDMNQQFHQAPLTREQHEVQAQYQQFFNQQRQLFYQMHHQQQQQFMYLQMQQMQQQQQQPQQQQQQIYYQQRPVWNQDASPTSSTIPVVQGFVPVSYPIPGSNQYQQPTPQHHQSEPEPTLPEVPIIPLETEEEPNPISHSKNKKPKNNILQEFPHIPQGTMQYIRPNTLSSIVSQSSMGDIQLPANVLDSYRHPPEPTVIEEVQPESSTPRELTEEEIFKRDNPLAWELSKLPQRFGVVPQTCSNSSDSSNNDLMYW